MSSGIPSSPTHDLEQLHNPSSLPSNAVSDDSMAALNTSAGVDPRYPAASLTASSSADNGLKASARSPNKRRKIIITAAIASVLIVLIILVVVLPVYFLVIKPRSNSAVASSGPGSGSGPPSGPSPGTPGLVMGGDGSLVTTDNGSTFIYNNTFGGYWYYDPSDPLNNSARPQQDVPPLNQTWKWGDDVIQGVNLGGWLVTEPFITPALYQKYPGTPDEWTLSLKMRADTAGGGIDQLEQHYKTFITEQDFAQIAAAGLNWIRLPIPYWAIEVWDGEPYLEGVCWKYALRAFEWARKYGLRINLDLHSVPGSQNPWWHSGRVGTPNFLYGPMGYANAQRTLDYIRILTEFISQDQYKNLIPLFGVLNEPIVSTLTKPEVERFYYQAHQTVRAVTGLGEGHGPFISFHDGFDGVEIWAGFLPGADRMAFDHHPYFAFSGGSSAPFSSFITQACDAWGEQTNISMTAFGMTTAGEWSLAWNDCGLYVNGVDGTLSYPGDCTPWNDWPSWTQDIKDNMRLFALNQMSALQNSFFWTWKVDPPASGVVGAPLWSYKLGLDNGWMPKNPRDARGVCPSTRPFVASSFLPWQVGGAGAGIFLGSTAAYSIWPPPTSQYLYAPNRPIPKLPTLTGYPSGVDVGDGWTNDADSTLAFGPNPGCQYPNAYDEGAVGPPTTACKPGIV